MGLFEEAAGTGKQESDSAVSVLREPQTQVDWYVAIPQIGWRPGEGPYGWSAPKWGEFHVYRSTVTVYRDKPSEVRVEVMAGPFSTRGRAISAMENLQGGEKLEEQAKKERLTFRELLAKIFGRFRG